MSEPQNRTTYEYKEVTVDKSYASFYLDAYKSFGWQVDDSFTPSANGTVLKLKRDRKLVNRVELTRLQSHFESDAADIRAMEHSKTALARVWAIVISIIGTAFIAGSVFAVTANPPIIWLCIVLAVPGFAGWIAPYFVYEFLRRKKTQQVTPFIEEKTEEMYSLCEKGQSLL